MRDTAKAALMARMGRFIFWPWRRTFEMLADKTMNVLEPIALHQVAVSTGGTGIRPKQAFIDMVGENGGAVKLLRLALKCSAAKRITVALKAFAMGSAESFGQMFAVAPIDCTFQLRPAAKQWVAMLAPSQIMHAAPASTGDRLAAIGNRAYPLNSHSEPPELRFGQNPLAALVTLGGFAISTAISLKIQGFQP